MVNQKTYDDLFVEYCVLMDNDQDNEYIYNKVENVLERMEKKLAGIKKNLSLGKKVSGYDEEFVKRGEKWLLDTRIQFYLNYGAFLKSNKKTDIHGAILALKKVLRLDRNNPIARYRLGFLSYKRLEYHDALQYFHQALIHTEGSNYALNSQQLKLAHIYKVSSSLRLMESSLQVIKNDKSLQLVDDYQMDFNSELLRKGEEFLNKNAFVHFSNNNCSFYSRDETDELIANKRNTLILYFGDFQTIFISKGVERLMDITHARLLRFLLLACSKDNPFTMEKYGLYFAREELLKKSFQKKMKRLIDNYSMQELILSLVDDEGNTSYYFNSNYSFVVIYRADTYTEYPYLH